MLFWKSYGRECAETGKNIQLPCPSLTNCYYGHPNKSGTAKDERDNRVTAHEPAEEAKVSCLHNRSDAADVEDAADAEQKAEKIIIKKKWQDVTIFYTEG